MKNIEINEKQKAMLLEMCKILFPEPEFSFWWEYEMYGRGLKQEFNDVLCVSETLNPPINVGTEEKPYFRTNNYFNIHWFEFCMTHLTEKILNPTPDKSCRTLQDKFKDFFFAWETNMYWSFYIDDKHINYDNPDRPKHPIDYLYSEFKKLKL